ncbi:MAG TPA: DUF1850 domain-containing protein [Thermovirgaceae bacterium]|nr:DUF1850 domain-containing protein [Thermovirgaceae bacterium]
MLKKKAVFFLISMVSAVLMAATYPVDVLGITEGDSVYYRRPVPVGFRFVSRYIHSVEKTPVEDDYRVVGGSIWSWEERVLSQNAGMPFVRPRNGRLIMDEDWMRFRGGRYSWEDLYVRIGDNRFGENEMFGHSPWTGYFRLFELLPSRRLLFSVRKDSLFLALLKGVEL